MNKKPVLRLKIARERGVVYWLMEGPTADTQVFVSGLDEQFVELMNYVMDKIVKISLKNYIIDIMYDNSMHTLWKSIQAFERNWRAPPSTLVKISNANTTV